MKQTLELQVLRSKSKDMVSKELILSMVGYNLVRAVMNAAAEPEGIDPRRLSFSRAQDVIYKALPGLETAATPAIYQQRVKRMLQAVACGKLPERGKRPSAPREVWGHSCKFPKRKPPPKE